MNPTILKCYNSSLPPVSHRGRKGCILLSGAKEGTAGLSIPKRRRYSSCSKLSVLGLVLLLIACTGTNESNEPSVATVNGHHFSVPLFAERYQQFLRQTDFQDNLQLRHTFLQSLIDEHLLLQWADSSGFQLDPVHQENLRALEDQLILNTFYERKIRPRSEPSEEELRRIYKWSKSKIHTRHLYAQNEETAQKLYERLQNGESWEALARETFQDPVLAGDGGDLGFFQMGDMDPGFELTAFQLGDGDISSPVKTSNGYSIIQVIEREVDPFLVENEFQQNRSELAQDRKSVV